MRHVMTSAILAAFVACALPPPDDNSGIDNGTDVGTDVGTDDITPGTSSTANAPIDSVDGQIVFADIVQHAECYGATESEIQNGETWFRNYDELIDGAVPSTNILPFRAGAQALTASDEYFLVNCFVNNDWFLVDTRVNDVDLQNGVYYNTYGTLTADGFYCRVVEQWVGDYFVNDAGNLQPTDPTWWGITYHYRCDRN